MTNTENFSEVLQHITESVAKINIDSSEEKSTPGILNGAFTTSIFICKNEKVYVNFKYNSAEYHDDNNFTRSFSQFSSSNIIFDNRLEQTILYQSVVNCNELLIYDIFKHRICTIYNHLYEKYKIKSFALNPSSIRNFSTCFLILNFYFKNLNFHCPPESLVGESVLESIINAIGPQAEEEYDTTKIDQITNFFNNGLEGIPPTVNRYEFYVALILMKNVNFRIRLKIIS
jgi:hypothetical protein